MRSSVVGGACPWTAGGLGVGGPLGLEAPPSQCGPASHPRGGPHALSESQLRPAAGLGPGVWGSGGGHCPDWQLRSQELGEDWGWQCTPVVTPGLQVCAVGGGGAPWAQVLC